MDEQALRIYLDEHLTGANAVIRLVERRLGDGAGPPWLVEFRAELEDDRDIVQGIVERLGTSGSLPAKTAGLAAQGTMRAALRLTETLHASLRDLIELEAMLIGVEGKACLWRTLEVLNGHPALANVDLDRLQHRADEQSARLEQLRRQAAADLGTDGDGDAHADLGTDGDHDAHADLGTDGDRDGPRDLAG